MWQFLTLSSSRAAARRTLVRGSRRHRPGCTPLEDRCLMSVALFEAAPGGPYVGSPVTWAASATGHGKKPIYQFSVGPVGGPLQVVRAYSSSGSFKWNPMNERTYEIQVVVKTKFGTASSEVATATYTAQTRVTGDTAVVSPTANPLVALYSALPSPGASMYVQFAEQGPALSWQNTSPLPIVPGESTNFIVAGMLPRTTYLMRDVLDNGTVSAPSSSPPGACRRTSIFPSSPCCRRRPPVSIWPRVRSSTSGFPPALPSTRWRLT